VEAETATVEVPAGRTPRDVPIAIKTSPPTHVNCICAHLSGLSSNEARPDLTLSPLLGKVKKSCKYEI